MKKFFWGAVCLVLFASCSGKGEPGAEQDTGGIKLDVAGFFDVDGIFANDSKSTLSINGGFCFEWENNDEIGIFPDPNTAGSAQQMMMIVDKSDNGSSDAEYHGSTVGWSLSPELNYASYFPMDEDYNLSPDSIELDYSGQKQTGNDKKGENMGHLGKYDYLYSDYVKPTGINNVTFKFKHAGAIVRFRVPTEVSGTFTSLTVTASSGNEVFPVKMKLDLFNPDEEKRLTAMGKSDTFAVSLENFEKTDDGYLNVWCMMPPVDLRGKTLTVTFNKGTASRNINYEIAGRELEPGKAYSFNGTDASLPDFIDLGLPSGTLWASWNVGATSETEVGNYYAWGETEPKNAYSKENYKFYRGPNTQDYTKYNNNEDKELVLRDGDDVATTIYGAGYRMPTDAEWTELKTYCSVTYSKGNGYTFTSNNGESIFFPESGYKNSDSVTSGAQIYCWAKNRDTIVNLTQAYRINVNTAPTVTVSKSTRYWGMPVRAVKPKSK